MFNYLLNNDYCSGFRWGGFQVDSPVKSARASEMPRLAPPYTFEPREEPLEGVWVETTNAREGFLRALFFDDVCMSQEGQSCQQGNVEKMYQGGLVIVK